MDLLSISAEEWVLNEEEYLKQLITPEIWKNIPLINSKELHNFKDGTLVRFRGMIQDMYGPEFYTERFDVINKLTNQRTFRNGKYSDGVVSGEEEKIDFENSTDNLCERHRFVAMSIPGTNVWVEQYENEKHRDLTLVDESRPTTSQNKRTYENMDVEDNTETEKSTHSSKRTTHEESAMTEQKRTLIVSREHILNHPLNDENPTVCHLSVYKAFEALKLNETCEFVGFLSINPVVDALFWDTNNEFEVEMLQTHHPPGSLVPRIHVVHFKNMRHINPLIGDNPISENMAPLSNIKKELVILLTQLLLGDSLGAEYLVCHLISEIYLRRNLMPLGKFSLNISNVPTVKDIDSDIDYVAELYKFLKMLVTKSHYLPLTVNNMNILTFVPKKNYECDRLTSGILQLSKNTLLVLDETQMEEGELGSVGVNEMQALATAIKNQKVPYDFGYYPIEYECDIRFLIFSEGKSILPSDVHIPLKPDETCLKTFNEILEAAMHFLKPELLRDLRIYLTTAPFIKYELSDPIQDLIQQEFVNMRQNGSITVEDMHSLLVLARLICLSEGKGTLDISCWRKACDMEEQRKARLKK